MVEEGGVLGRKTLEVARSMKKGMEPSYFCDIRTSIFPFPYFLNQHLHTYVDNFL